MADSPRAYTDSQIGVCVLTFNSESVVEACVDALQRELQGQPHRIVVVDNCSRDNSAEIVEQRYPGVTVVRSPVNGGYARGNNLGAQTLLAAGCKYLALVNPDVTVAAGTLSRLRSVLAAREDAGCAGGAAASGGRVFRGSFRTKPTFAEKLWLYSSARYFPLLQKWTKRWTEKLEARHFIEISTVEPVYAVSGACMMFPSAAFEKIGGFDETTFLYQEEFIISERLKRAGYKVYGDPDATYDHELGHSAHANFVRSKRCFIASEQYFLRAYCDWGLPLRAMILIFRWADLMAWVALARVKRMRTWVLAKQASEAALDGHGQ